MEKRIIKIIVSLTILIVDLIFCTVIGNYCLSKNDSKTIATTLNIEDIMTKEQLNIELLNKYDGQYIRIENYTVKGLNYYDNDVSLSTYKTFGSKTNFEGAEIEINVGISTSIYLIMQDTNRTLRHQLKNGDKITIEGKLIKSEESKPDCCSENKGKKHSLYLNDYKITNIDTSNEVKMPTSTDGYYDDIYSTTPNPETMLYILTKRWNYDIEKLQQLHKKNYPETDRQVAINLTPAQIKQDESEEYKTLSQYKGKYIRISDYKYNDWYNIEEWVAKSKSEKITAICLKSSLIKSEETGSFGEHTIDIVSILDSSDTTTLNHLLKKGDKITIEGKLDDYNIDSNYIRLTNCRIIE